jgi:hypothetical protein
LACAPVADIHVTYGVAAAAIAAEDGPVHDSLAKPSMINP